MVKSDVMGEEYNSPIDHNLERLPYLTHEDNGRWRDKAKCKGQPELLPLFFTDYPTSPKYKRVDMVAEAKVYCDQCSVRKECFAFAKSNNIQHGVWGGIDFFTSSNGTIKHVIPDSID
jgi:hypothetical protein